MFADVDIEHPDKKSIMMYVMCYFQVLPHSNIVIDSDPETPTENVPVSKTFSSIKADTVENAQVKVTTTLEQTQVDGGLLVDVHNILRHSRQCETTFKFVKTVK